MSPVIVHDAGNEFRPALLEELLDDLLTMLHQRAWLSFSPDISLSSLQRHDRRIAALVDALVLAQHQSAPPLLAMLAEGEREAGVIAALLLSLQESEHALEALREGWQASDEVARDGLRLGLGTLEARDRAWLHGGPDAAEHIQVAAAWLRIQDGTAPEIDELERWLCSPDCSVRTLAFRTLACFAAGQRQHKALNYLVREERLIEALGDVATPGLAEAALWTAAVWRKAWALDWARAQLHPGAAYKADACKLLVAAGQPADIALLLQARTALGTQLYADLLARIGNVACGDRLLNMVTGEEALAAALAGQALARMTGVDTTADERLRIPTPGLSEEDDDFAEEVRVVDAARASAVWSGLRGSLSPDARARCGLDLNRLEGELSWPESIDMQARFMERMRLFVQAGGRSRDLEFVPWTASFSRGVS